VFTFSYYLREQAQLGAMEKELVEVRVDE